MEKIKSESLLKAARQAQEEYPGEVQIVYSVKGKGSVYASLKASARIMELVREGE